MISDQELEDTLTELSILRSKVAAVLDCIVDNANAREQTLTCIASDYLTEMDKMIQAMQKSTFTPNRV